MESSHNAGNKMSSPPPPSQPPPNNTTHSLQSHIPIQFRAISRNNSNLSTASSSNKGDISSTISTANSVASSRSQISKHRQLIDHRQLLATCGSSTPIRSFQRATISSVVKTRAFDNNPVLQGLLIASPSGQNSVSNSHTPSPLSTPVFSRSRSLRMSGGPQRYQQSPSHYRTSSRTPELSSFNSGDISSCSNESQAKLMELNNEKVELKENLEFLECERQVLIEAAKDLKETLQLERSHWRKDQDELKKQLTDTIAARLKAESQLTHNEMEMNDIRIQMKRTREELMSRDRQLEVLRKNTEALRNENVELYAMNDQLRQMLTEKLKYNGLTAIQHNDGTNNQQVSDCSSIVTEMARLRLELNQKDRLIDNYERNGPRNNVANESGCQDIESLNKFLDQTVECIKGWPEELAGSSHVQNLMKTLLRAYKADQDDLSQKMENIHL